MKTKLIKLAKEVGFESDIVPLTAWNEDLRYYLWMCELQKWCREKHSKFFIVWHNTLTNKFRVEREDSDSLGGVFAPLPDVRREYDMHEQALEEGLHQTLLLIQKENGINN